MGRPAIFIGTFSEFISAKKISIAKSYGAMFATMHRKSVFGALAQ
jgi:hypothetical protein